MRRQFWDRLYIHFSAEAADHSYDAVYQVVRKTVVLFRGNGSVGRKTGSEDQIFTSIRKLSVIRQIKEKIRLLFIAYFDYSFFGNLG
jgi:hypothetical protein